MNAKAVSGIGHFLGLVIAVAIIGLAIITYTLYTDLFIRPLYQEPQEQFSAAILHATILADLLRMQVDSQNTIGWLLSLGKYSEACDAAKNYFRTVSAQAEYALVIQDPRAPTGVYTCSSSKASSLFITSSTSKTVQFIAGQKVLVYTGLVPLPDSSTMEVMLALSH